MSWNFFHGSTCVSWGRGDLALGGTQPCARCTSAVAAFFSIKTVYKSNASNGYNSANSNPNELDFFFRAPCVSPLHGWHRTTCTTCTCRFMKAKLSWITWKTVYKSNASNDFVNSGSNELKQCCHRPEIFPEIWDFSRFFPDNFRDPKSYFFNF